MIACEPRLSVEIVSAACPEPFSGTVASGVVPSAKVTVPPWAPLAELTDATKVTVCPKTGELLGDVSVIVVAAGAITKVRGLDWAAA